MEAGFNSDIVHNGKPFHIQTEDWGKERATLVTRVFREGAVLKTVKSDYEKVLLEGTLVRPQAIRLAMKKQHQEILDLILSGKLA